MHEAYIVRLKEIRPHSNADRLQIATVFGNNVIVSLDYKVGDLCIYFPSDLQLGEEYAVANDLVRRKDENGNACGGYLDPVKRRITAIKLRGEQSDGLLMPIESLRCLGTIDTLKEGDVISIFNGKALCNKYMPPVKKIKNRDGSISTVKPKVNHFPTFAKHADTSQLAYNLGQFKTGDRIVITAKLHGTSGRTGYMLREELVKPVWYKRLFGAKEKYVSTYEMISGSRNVVLENMETQIGYYGTNDFRSKWHNFFDGKLQKGETVYYEIVGASAPSGYIMPSCGNKALGKEFIKKYGDTTNFTYGCDIENGENRVFVYRMTMTNIDGYVIEYPWELVRLRCEQMGIPTVPLMLESKVVVVDDVPYLEYPSDVIVYEALLEEATYLSEGADLIDSTHIREGVVVRIDNSPTFKAFKHKSFDFKVISGIASELAEGNIEQLDEDLLSEM